MVAATAVIAVQAELVSGARGHLPGFTFIPMRVIKSINQGAFDEK
jgi:hypothetical protein